MAKLSTLAPFGRSALKLFLACVLILSVSSAFGEGSQQHPAPPAQPPTSPPPTASVPPSPTEPSAVFDQWELMQRNGNKLVSPVIAERDNCFLAPLNELLLPTVDVANLDAPSEARREDMDGCAALRKHKMTEAEGHLRNAVKQWPKYLGAWVVLGQVLEVQQKIDEAYGACSQPLATDPNYLPAYLCLADISARSESWNKVLRLSTRALEIDPTDDAVAYHYNAAANFYLHRLPEAEKSALRAVEIDKGNADPRVHFLLAQIYQAKGDRENEAAQLREYLKHASRNDVATIKIAKRYLSELEKPTK
jgi:tetratricopeptide (TPR) repeat protein